MSKTPTRCWCCRCIITRGTSLATIDPNIRVCWNCDGKVKRKPAASFGNIGRHLALLDAIDDREPVTT